MTLLTWFWQRSTVVTSIAENPICNQLGHSNHDEITVRPFVLEAKYRRNTLIFSYLVSSPDLNLTPLAAFLRFCRAQRGSDRTVLEIRGWTATREINYIEAWWWKSCTYSKYLHHLWRDELFMWRSRYSEIFISTYIPTYKGNSLRKSLHHHRCYFGFTFEVRSCHVISLICIAISEIGNANSQVSKPNALMRWFSQLLCVSLGGFDANCTHNISTLQN